MFYEKPWFRSGVYESYDRLEQMKSFHPVRSDRGKFTLGELFEIIANGNPLLDSFLSIGDDIPLNLIPYGRNEQEFIDRDYTYYIYTKRLLDILGESLNNTLIINMTGHEGAVAAALAEKNIPCNWQISINSNMVSKRIAEQLQDYSNIILRNNFSNNLCTGLILEPKHSSYEETIDINRLPNINTLKKMGIKKCLVLTEDTFNSHSKKGCSSILEYLNKLAGSQIGVGYIGVGDSKGSKADFHYTNTELINPEEYLDNFNMNTHKNNR